MIQKETNSKQKYSNIDEIGNEPKFVIYRNPNEEKKVIKGNSRINLAIASKKFRLTYLFRDSDEEIPLVGDIYYYDYFKKFIKFACDGFEDEELYKIDYLIYLYAYSDIWGYDELMKSIYRIWIGQPSKLDIEKNEKNKEFLVDIIKYIKRVNKKSNLNDNELPEYIGPDDFYEQNINTILGEDIKKNKFRNLPPEILNIIIQKIPKKKLKGKIYFNFLMDYIQEAYDRKKDLLPYAILVNYVDLSVLNYDNLKKYVNMKFIKDIDSKKKKCQEEEISIEEEEEEEEEDNYTEEEEEDNYKEEEEEEESDDDDYDDDDEKVKNQSKQSQKNKRKSKLEEKDPSDDYSKLFDIISFTQFISFARILIDENEKNKKEIVELRSDLKKLKKQYEEKNEELRNLALENQEKAIEEAKNLLKPVEKKLNENEESISNIDHHQKDFDYILNKIEENSKNYNDISNNFDIIKKQVSKINYNYQLSSYIISSINRQFIPINENKLKCFDHDIKDIKLVAKINIDKDLTQNEIKNIFSFSISENNSQMIYFYSKMFTQVDQNQNGNQNQSDNNFINNDVIFTDFMIKEYEIEVDKSDSQPLSWEIEGFFPKDYEDYEDYTENKDYKYYNELKNEQWFPISQHNVAEFNQLSSYENKLNYHFDIINIDKNYTKYKCSMGFSPICKCIRLKLTRNSNDNKELKIKQFSLAVSVLHPFFPKQQIKK